MPDGGYASSSSRLQFSLEQAKRHLSLLDPVATRFTFSTFDDNKERSAQRRKAARERKEKPRDPLARILHGRIEEHWQTLCQLNADGAGVFISVNETDGRGAKTENVVRVRAIWQEADRGNEPDLPTEPHLIISTSPGRRHCYVLTDGCPLEGRSFEDVQQRLVDDYGSDKDAKDRRRVLRLAGFYHQKRPEAPYLVHVTHESGQPPLPWSDVLRLFPPVERCNTGEAPPPGDGEVVKIAEVVSALRCLDPDADYGDWLNIGFALHHASGGGREGLALWDDWSAGGGKHKEGECEYRWSTFGRTTRRPVTVGTLFRMAGAAGWNGEISLAQDVLPLVDKQRSRQLLDFGKRHAVVMVNGKAAVVWQERDGNTGHATFRFGSRGDVLMKYEPDRIPVLKQTANGPTVERKPLVPIWLASAYRKTYEQVVFAPVAGKVAKVGQLPEGRMLNLYTGLNIKPRAGDCSLILEHIREVWCAGEQTAYDFVMGWLARMFQAPNEQGHTVLVLRSGEGTGKGIVVDLLVEAFGEAAFVATKHEDITGRFNDQLASSVFVHLNEALWGGNKAHEGALKSLITDPDLPIERKYLPKFRVRNCTHLIVASNNDWPVPVGIDDRRFLVLDVSEHRKGDHAYFQQIADQINNGGKEALVYELLNRDVTGFNPRALPNVASGRESKLDMKLQGTDSVTQWWASLLADGGESFPVGEFETPAFRDWEAGPVEVSRRDMFNAYQLFAQANRQHILHPVAFGKKLRKLGAVKARVQRSTDGGVARYDVLHHLTACREAFERTVRQEIDWSDGGDL